MDQLPQVKQQWLPVHPHPHMSRRGHLVKTKYQFMPQKIPSRDWTERGMHIKHSNMLIVDLKVNKAVVGSGHGDVPKYMGEGVASHVLLSMSGGKHRLGYSIFHVFW